MAFGNELNYDFYCGHSALLGNKKRDWQDVDYELSYFGKQLIGARRQYYDFVSEGVHQGRRNDLTGGGLIRSLGGWSAITKSDLKGTHIKSDERILGDSYFVDSLLSTAAEKYKRCHDLKCLGYDLDKTARRAAEVCGIELEDVFSRSRQRTKVKARSLFCYWTSRELGISYAELARRLGISILAVSHSVERGATIMKEQGYQLLE